MLGCCYKVSCKKCLEDHLIIKSSCPTCREDAPKKLGTQSKFFKIQSNSKDLLNQLYDFFEKKGIKKLFSECLFEIQAEKINFFLKLTKECTQKTICEVFPQSEVFVIRGSVSLFQRFIARTPRFPADGILKHCSNRLSFFRTTKKILETMEKKKKSFPSRPTEALPKLTEDFEKKL